MTTKTTHTPGPWLVADDGYNVKGPNGEYVGFAAIGPRGGQRERGLSNARLIAMAPGMLEALRRHVAVHDNYDSTVTDVRLSGVQLADEARAILRALDTPHTPCPVSPESKEPCPVCGPAVKER